MSFLDELEPRQRRLLAAAVAIVLVLLLGLGAWLFLPESASEAPTIEPPPRVETSTEAAVPYRLYFPGEGGKLYLEEHELLLEGGLDVRAQALVEALLAGPRSASLAPPLPGEVAVQVYLDGGVAYLDFTSPAARPPASGSLHEMLTVYSVVDTLLENLTEIEGVVLLWNGLQHSTFAGHLDTTRPLGAQRVLIADADETPADSWPIDDAPANGDLE